MARGFLGSASRSEGFGGASFRLWKRSLMERVSDCGRGPSTRAGRWPAHSLRMTLVGVGARG